MKNNVKKLIASIGVLILAVAFVPTTHVFAATINITTYKAKADQEIDRRLTSLNAAIARINEAQKLSATDKSSLVTMAENSVSTLTTLEATINADTNVTTLKADRQGITKNYRIYLLVLRQINITAAADRVQTIAGLLGGVVTKLQTSITTAQTAGKDVTVMSAALADMQAKIADANTQSANAQATVLPLVPDQGNQTVLASNNAAFTSARSMITACTSDLVAARADAQTIVNALKALGM